MPAQPAFSLEPNMNPDLISTAWPCSLWTATAVPLDDLPALEGVSETEVGIVGAGYTGLSTALHLAEAGMSSVVIDRNQPGWGCSGRNGGQVNPNWKVLPEAMRRHYGRADLEAVIQMANGTCDLVFDLIRRHDIDCQAIRPGYVLGIVGHGGQRYRDQWLDQWRVPGSNVEILGRRRIGELLGTDHYDCGLLDRRGGSVQPLSYARGLAKTCLKAGVSIHGDTPALSIERDGSGWRIRTPRGAVRCRGVVIGTNGYSDRLWPTLRENVVPVASLISATAPLPDELARKILPNRNAVSELGGVPNYYRVDENNRMVFGGRGTVFGRTGKLDTLALRRSATKLFPELRSATWEFDWGGYVAMTTHHRPLLLRLDDMVHAGLGYNGRGVAMATMMGKQLAMAVTEGKSELPMEISRPIPLHRFHGLGIAARLVGGTLVDAGTRRIR